MVRCPNCPHPLKGIHNKYTGRCKMCRCEGPEGKVKGGYASDLAKQHVSEPRRARRQTEAPPAPVVSGDIGGELSREFRRLTKNGGKS